ncbi:MAG: hypothetical protein V3U11_00745 [Planctomycetota bacterium]
MKQEHEFEQFLQAHANKELTTDERTQLGVLAMQDPERQLTVAEFEELHRRMDEERRLAAAVMAPADPSEETHESYRRLVQAAGRAQQQLQAELMNPTRGGERLPLSGSVIRARSVLRGPRFRRLAWAMVAAAAVVVTALLVFDGGAPALNPNQPGADKIGRPGNIILLNPIMTPENRRLSWIHAQGARSYDAQILDAQNAVVLARPQADARSNEWRLTKAQYDLLKAHPGDLFLRVVARDGAGVGFGTSTDLRLDIR